MMQCTVPSDVTNNSQRCYVTVLGGGIFEATEAQKTNGTTLRQSPHREGRRRQSWGYPAPSLAVHLAPALPALASPTATEPVLGGNGAHIQNRHLDGLGLLCFL